MLGFGDGSLWYWVLPVVLAVAVFLWLRPRHHFTIAVRDGHVEISGTFPVTKRGAVVGFFEQDMKLSHRVLIRGLRERSGRLKLAFRGQLGPWERQRIRNFLLTTL